MIAAPKGPESRATAAAEAPVAPKGRRTIPLRDVTLPHRCPKPLRLRVLGRAPYFKTLSPQQLEDVDARMQTRVVPAGQPVYHSGQPARELYVVAEGRVKLSQVTSDGTETLTDIHIPGELFGAMGALGEPNHLQSAHALVDTCLLYIGQIDFRRVLEAHPKVALEVLDSVALRLRQAHSDAGGQATSTVKQRVATALLRLAEKVGRPAENGVLIDTPLSRADLAGLARSTPESVSRVMSAWKKEGVISSGRRWVALEDVGALGRVAAG